MVHKWDSQVSGSSESSQRDNVISEASRTGIGQSSGEDKTDCQDNDRNPLTNLKLLRPVHDDVQYMCAEIAALREDVWNMARHLQSCCLTPMGGNAGPQSPNRVSGQPLPQPPHVPQPFQGHSARPPLVASLEDIHLAELPQIPSAQRHDRAMPAEQSHSSSPRCRRPSLSLILPMQSSDSGEHAEFPSENLAMRENESWRYRASVEKLQVADVDRRCLFKAGSLIRLMWDMSSLIVLIFDAFMTPFLLSWNPNPEGMILVGAWATALFWSADVVVNLRTSYFTESGDLEADPGRIFRRYLRSTMILDLFICTADWIGIFLEHQKIASGGGDSEQSGVDGLALSRVIKISRAFKILGALRASQLSFLFVNMGTKKFGLLFSSTAQLVYQLLGLFVFIVWLNHFFCCIWYLIGTSGSTSDTGVGWLDNPVPGLQGTTIATAGVLFQYTTAYHWSISQLTPGSMEVVPQNSRERAFNVSVLLFGLLFCTSLISQLSALMIKLQIANQDKALVIRKLRTFLRQKSVSASVSQRVEQHVREQLSIVPPLGMQDLPILNTISQALQMDLKADMFSRDILHQSIFACCDSISELATRALCNSLELRLMFANEALFKRDEVTTISYVLTSGSMAYMLDNQSPGSEMVSAHCIQPTLVEVSDRFWVSSASFWTDWKTKGCMEARQHSEVICIDRKKVSPALMKSYLFVAKLLSSYRKRFMELWFGMREQEREQVNDLGDAVNHATVVMGLSKPMRDSMYEPLLEVIRQKNWARWGSAQGIKNLQEELDMGKCSLVSAKDGSVMRVAVVVVLQVTRPHGELLLELAEIKEDQCKFRARPPGTKLQEQETPTEAAHRALGELVKDIGEDPAGFELGGMDGIVKQCSASPTYGLQTEYHRNIFNAYQDIESDKEAPRLTTDGATKQAVEPVLSSSSMTAADWKGMQHAPDLIQARMPKLARHYPHHLYILSKPNKTVIYAWVHPDDIEVIFDWKDIG